jgi:hypothetical protein
MVQESYIRSLPSTLTSIGYWAFDECGSLSSVSILAQTPPALCERAFLPNARIMVPAASLDAYKSATGWERYSNQLEAQP